MTLLSQSVARFTVPGYLSATRARRLYQKPTAMSEILIISTVALVVVLLLVLVIVLSKR
jgi:hypothetical protein